MIKHNAKIEFIFYRLVGSLITAVLFLSCSPKNLTVNYKEESISGSVLPIVEAKILQQTIRPLSCTLPKAHLYVVKVDGSRILPAIAQADISSEGAYSFKLKKNTLKDKTLLVEISGCDTALARNITGSRSQDVSFGTSLISWVSEGPQAAQLQSADKTKLAQLFKLIENSSSMSQAYSILLSDSKIQNLFGELFNVSPNTLLDVAPVEGTFNVASTGTEGSPLDFSMTTTHWSATYQEAFIWKLDTTVIGTSSNVSFIPSQNSQGTHSLTVYYGKADGSGNLDLAKPYKSKNFSLTVADTFPSIVPNFDLVSSVFTNNPAISVSINTGPGMSNCQSFSKLAIVEDVLSMPLFESDFNLSCSQAPSQNLTVGLIGSDGPHTLYLWVRDSAGKISLTPKTVIVNLDRINPVVTVSTPLSNQQVNGAFAISGSCEQGLPVNFGGQITTNSSTTCNLGLFSTTLTPTSGEGEKTITLTQTDLAGNIGSITHTVVRDDTAPALTITSPSPSASTQSSILVSGTCSAAAGDVATVQVSGIDLQNSPFTALCSNQLFSFTAVLLNSDGAKSITISQSDTAGNLGSATLNLIRDTTPPALIFTSPGANQRVQAGLVVQGTCEAGTVELSGQFSTSPLNIACSSGGFSQAIILNSPDGLKNVTISESDLSGNSATMTRQFLRDMAAPTLTISAPAVNGRIQSNFNLVGSCEPGGSIAFSGDIAAASTINCSGGGTFSQSLSLTAGDGVKTISLTHTNSIGNVATLSRSFVRDNSSPTLNITSPNSNTATQLTISLTGSCGQLADDSTNVVITGANILNSPVTTTCSAGTYSETLTLLGSDGTKAITATQLDEAQNSSPVTRNFVKDTAAPLLSFSTPAALFETQSTVIITGACESGLTVNLNGDINSTSASCAGSVFSSTVTFSAGDGSKNVSLLQTDSAGNASTVSRVFVKDTVSPVLSFTAPAAMTSTQSTLNISGTCEANKVITLSGSGLTSPATTSCTGGLFSEVVTLTNTDGNKVVTASQTDAANNTGSASRTFIRDNTAPILSLSSPAAATATQSSLTLNGSCGALTGDLAPVTISGSFSGFPLTSTCTAGSFSQTITLTGADGAKTINLSQTDNAGNSTNISSSFLKDTVAPVLSISSPLASAVFNSSFTLTGTCETGLGISLSGPATGTFSCSGGAFSAPLTLTGSDGTKSISLTQIDAAGNSTVSNRSFTKDILPPQVTSFNLNSGSTSATNNYFQATASMTDITSNVLKFCMKYNSVVAPTLSDSCWVSVQNPNPGLTPAPTINLNNFVYQVGFGSGSYKVSIWAVDEAGNISSLTAAGACTSGTDCKTMSYAPGAPPTVTNILVASTSTPSQPQSNSDLTISSGSSAFIKWTASSTVGFSTNPISLSYTTDDITYTPITGASSLLNGVNGSCVINEPSTTADDLATGCFIWSSGSPTSSYYKIRVLAQDTNGMATSSTSQSLNVATSLRMIAGNTDPGLNASASSAMFFNNLYYASVSDHTTLVIAKNGTVFFRDALRGILFVDPANGIQKIFIPKTGTSSGDGGSVASATLKDPVKIALDFDNNLLIIDYDRIRKVDLNATPMTISTFIGGGTSALDDVDPLQVKINYLGAIDTGSPSQHSLNNVLIPAPNGDLYFYSSSFSFSVSPSGGYKMRHFKKSLNQVTSYAPSGTGYSAGLATDLSNCKFYHLGFTFDLTTKLPTSVTGTIVGTAGTNCTSDGFTSLHPVTGVTLGTHPPTGTPSFVPRSGMDGKLYFISRNSGLIRKWDSATRTMTTILGTGGAGSCVDGTVATSCQIDPQDVFVTAQGTVYFMDKGRVRTIDDQNKVVTIMGQGFSFGDTGQALSARFNVIGNLAHWNNGSVDKLIILDQQEFRFRELTFGGTIDTIAGIGANGLFNYTSLATSQPLITTGSGVSWDDFVASPIDGSVYYNNSNSAIGKLNRTTNKWQVFVGGGATSYTTADGVTGVNVKTNSSNYPTHLIGINGTEVVASYGRYNTPTATIEDMMMKKYSLTNGTQSSLMGVVGPTPAWASCTDGSAANTCAIPYIYGVNATSRSNYDGYVAGGRWTVLHQGYASIRVINSSGIVSTLTTLDHIAINHEYLHDASKNIVYYCSGTDFKIHKRDITSGIESILAWPVASMKCTGRSLVHVPSRNSLIFIYTQNGMYGVAEHTSL